MISRDDGRVAAPSNPRRVVHPFLDVPTPFVLAHRGFDRDGLENSMRAFGAAVDLGVTHLETDVRATADGVLVAFHDADLDRVTDAHGPIGRLPWREVQRARIGGIEPIPTLEDVLGSWPSVRLNVDLKCAAAVRPFVDVVRRTGARDRVCVAAFAKRRTAAAVRDLRELGPVAFSVGPGGVAAALGVSRVGGPDDAGRRVRRALRGAVCLQVPERVGRLTIVDARTVDAVHAAGAQVHVWTVDEPSQMERLLDLGVDALVTNRSDLALAAVARRAGRADG
jgi:glycerophosphoryl diester phosphodiesterase